MWVSQLCDNCELSYKMSLKLGFDKANYFNFGATSQGYLNLSPTAVMTFFTICYDICVNPINNQAETHFTYNVQK